MAWNTLREEGALSVTTTVDEKSALQIILSAILVNVATLGLFLLAPEGPWLFRMAERSLARGH